MRTCAVLALLLGVSLFAGTTHAAVSAGEISIGTRTSSTVTVQIDTLSTLADSLYICYLSPLSSSDTTFIALLDTTCTDTTITGLSSKTLYNFFTVARDASGDTDVSENDTTHTYKTQIGDVTGRIPYMTRKVATDASWPFGGNTNVSFDTVFDLNDANASDYSLIYYALEGHNAVRAIATQAGDSTVASIYWYPVHVVETMTDTTFYRAATIADSVNITTAGVTVDTVTLPFGRYYQMLVYSLLGNGKDADIEIYFDSSVE